MPVRRVGAATVVAGDLWCKILERLCGRAPLQKRPPEGADGRSRGGAQARLDSAPGEYFNVRNRPSPFPRTVSGSLYQVSNTRICGGAASVILSLALCRSRRMVR